jgi:predicted  nucleic acid-binding Zn-ribbon protein
MTKLLFIALSAFATSTQAATVEARANPIRKVVNLLQALQKKVTAEGERAEDLYQKFMCYCKNSGGDLQASITAAEEKIPQLTASIEAASDKKSQLEADLKAHQTDRAAAKKAMDEATAIRKKEKAAYDKALADNKANLAATRKAATAVEQGMKGGFLQTQAAQTLRALVAVRQGMAATDRQDLLSFLSGQEGSEYAPAAGEISGILKTMADEMAADQKDMIATESGSVENYESLVAAKKKEVAALSKSIEEKSIRVGDLGVEIATMKNDAEDTTEALAEDTKFHADMKKNCAEKTGIHEEEKKMRAQELVALADTIKVLNDDDALELFKKTLPSAGSSLIQMQATRVSLQEEARKALASVHDHRHLDFILLALRGKKIGFGKIIKLIDELVATLKKEQQDDDDKKEYCAKQFDQADDKKKALERSIADLETVIAETKESIATLGEEITALNAGIKALDKAVAEATEQRKAESAEYKELMTSNTAAKELILFAKNRLNKFYNPKLYKAPPKRELSEGDQIYENEGGDIPAEAPGGIANTGIGAFIQLKRDAPPPPPATAEAYKKKSGESNGVIAMMDLLVKDLDKEMQIAEVEEKNAKEEYEQTIADASEKRRQDSKSLTDKKAAKAEMESSLEKSISDKASDSKSLMGTMKYIGSLHAECDWLVQYYDVRKQARADEIDALEKAKAVLSGADYSLIQRSESARTRKFLRRA